MFLHHGITSPVLVCANLFHLCNKYLLLVWYGVVFSADVKMLMNLSLWCSDSILVYWMWRPRQKIWRVMVDLTVRKTEKFLCCIVQFFVQRTFLGQAAIAGGNCASFALSWSSSTYSGGTISGMVHPPEKGWNGHVPLHGNWDIDHLTSRAYKPYVEGSLTQPNYNHTEQQLYTRGDDYMKTCKWNVKIVVCHQNFMD